jgi:hypothetical protein
MNLRVIHRLIGFYSYRYLQTFRLHFSADAENAGRKHRKHRKRRTGAGGGYICSLDENRMNLKSGRRLFNNATQNVVRIDEGY